MKEKLRTTRERWPATVSLAMMIINGDSSHLPLLLVRKKDSQQWGLPAGGLHKGEQLAEAAYRELKEETGLNPDDITNLNHPEVLVIPGETKTSIGLVYIAIAKRPLPKKGVIPDSSEIDLVRPFTIKELEELLRHPEKIYKPGFNVPAIRLWFDHSKTY